MSQCERNTTALETGRDKIMAQIVFGNGANRLIFLTDGKAVLLS
jgi:hypothetical protein